MSQSQKDPSANYKAQKLLYRLGHPAAQGFEKEANAGAIARNMMRAEGTINNAIKALGIGAGVAGSGYVGHEIGHKRGVEQGKEQQRGEDLDSLKENAQAIFEAGRNFEREQFSASMPKTAEARAFEAWDRGELTIESFKGLNPTDLRKIATYAYDKKEKGSPSGSLLWSLLQTL